MDTRKHVRDTVARRGWPVPRHRASLESAGEAPGGRRLGEVQPAPPECWTDAEERAERIRDSESRRSRPPLCPPLAAQTRKPSPPGEVRGSGLDVPAAAGGQRPCS